MLVIIVILSASNRFGVVVSGYPGSGTEMSLKRVWHLRECVV